MTNVDTKSLFVFGTMRDRDVLELVLGRALAPERYRAATIEGYRITLVPDERYPTLVKAPGQHAHGEVVHGLDGTDLDRVLFFESDEYALNPCRVLVEGHTEIEALFCDDLALDPRAVEPWSLEDWQAEHKKGFLEIARRFMSFYGRGSRDEAEALWLELETARNSRSTAA